MNRHRKMFLAVAFCATISWRAGLAQTAPESILQVDFANAVLYQNDVSDPTKLASDPTLRATAATRPFQNNVVMADIIAVNGTPAKGALVAISTAINLTPVAVAGQLQAIGDTQRPQLTFQTWEILQADGTPVGTLNTQGVVYGAAPPGGFLGSTGNLSITGGTGAFLGVRGQAGRISQTVATRNASQTEDPANRRLLGGGATRFVFHVIATARPETVTTSGGPAVYHADFTPVNAAKPAKAGEVLIVRATGLGPTVPGVDPGQPFPSDTTQTVNSPVAVTVNGKPAAVINAIGWPGQVDTYRVDFRVPDGATAGTASIQLTAAWIPGSAVGIPVQ